jgi:NAD(P)-dependent dehydrogenase (short-subunit alcohol dehydrogenase family)
MQISLSGRTALVTGGSRGIGRAIAERFAASGATVVIVARRPEIVAETVRDLAGTGRVSGYPLDVCDGAAVDKLMPRIAADVGPIDILVNNAGTSARGPLMALEHAGLMDDYDIKVAAAVRLSQHVLPHMRAQRWGRIVNMSTVNGKAPRANGAPTALSRAAGIALGKVMAGEFAADNVLVNTICSILSDQWTRLHQEDAPDLSFDDYIKKRGREVPLGRVGAPEDVANLACFLASDAASYITGTAINIDGGRSPVT